ncbi:cingulin isoform X1 [Hyla sarda]|uniref:cingulin isoform X1 n=1 Tax=Hyla sarda TaxID=327740 RepID=UPI0024C23DFB|nr:cingulin isoform X1 [Hyla sarda]XP_056401978.1 cingulin isoform X1 [Hyla sarda]
MERRVHGDMAEQHLPVGQGVQIRFIDDLKENKKPRSIRSKHDSYGVAIRVQGIDGQPFVVLNSGDKSKSSYGVQIKTNNAYGNSSANPTPDYQGLASKASRTIHSLSPESDVPENPYGNRTYSQVGSQYSSTSDEEQNSRPRSKPRALQPARREELRRSQSHGSLVDAELEDSYGYDGHYSERSSTLDTTYSQSSGSRGSLKTADNGEVTTGKYKPATSQQPTSFSTSLQRKSGLSTSSSPKLPSEDIDTKPLSSVDSLINKFDTKVQMRGRTARRSQALKDERKRSQSLDGRSSHQDTADYREVQTTERSVQQERTQSRPLDMSYDRASLERESVNKPRLTKEWLAQTLEDPLSQSQQRTVQAELQLKSTPDLLKDQQQDDPTREMIYSILRDGSNESDIFLRKKTSLLLEKIQSFQASPGEDTRTLVSQKKDLERRVSELQQQLDIEMKQRLRQEASQERPRASTLRLEIQLEESVEECKKLKELLEKKKNELNAMSQELIEVRMSKEQVDTKLRSLEGKLQDTKEEVNQMQLKGASGDKHALLKELQEMQEELDTVLQIRNRQDDLLRQKERELTALKGALKDEVANHDQEMERVRQQYQNDMQQLRKNMDNVSQDQLSLESERQKINQVVRNLQREVEESSEEINQWKEMFQKNKEELRKSKEEVLQLKLEKEEFEDELNEMKNRFSLVQSELGQVKKDSVNAGEAEFARKELQRFQEQVKQLMQEKQRLEETLRQRDRELSALKGALKDEVSGRDHDLEQLREQFSRELQQAKKEYEEHMRELQKVQDQVKPLMQEKHHLEETLFQRDRELSALKGVLKDKVSGQDREAEKMRELLNRELQQAKRDYEELFKVQKKVEDEKADAERMRQVVENTLQDTRDENDDLRRKILGLEAQVKELKTFCDDLQRAETRVKDKIGRMEAERQRMEETLGEATDQSQEFALVRRDLENKLDEAQRNLKRLTLEYEELQECYQQEIQQKDQLKKTKNELEEQKRLLDKAMDKLTRELDNMSNESRDSLQILQMQLEEYKEKSRKEMNDSQKQAKEKTAEAERLQINISRLQEEVQRLKQALQETQAEKESAVLDKELVSQRLQSIQQDIDTKKRFQDDRSRQVKVMEDKMKRLEAELDEEKNSVELLTDRVNRSRDQMEQLRGELMQERTRSQDLECDKISLERQNKELRNRLADVEGQQKPNASLSHLEAKLQEVQERLQMEEREKNTLQSSNRKLDRKLKELNIQLEDERLHVNDQKDQLNLRVKALKRQVDEAEEEIERMEALRKKAQRELEEQLEINEQLQGRLKAMEKESRRKPVRPAADDDLSSDDGSYDPSSIASLLTESNLQTSSC